jgi:hypothetical protein
VAERSQVLAAVVNAGPARGIPLIVTVELPGLLWIENPPAPWPAVAAVGSGKFDTPWDRIHCAMFTSAL